MGGSDSMENQPLILAVGLEDGYLGATELLADSYSSSQLFKTQWWPQLENLTVIMVGNNKKLQLRKLGYTR